MAKRRIPTEPSEAAPKPLYSENEIQKRVRELAAEIRRDFDSQPMVVVGVLKGAFIFMSDLVRHLDAPVYCDFLRAVSYGPSTPTGGAVRIELDLAQPIENRNVLLVEDIVDRGLTLNAILDYLRPKKPKLLKVCALVIKRRKDQLPVPVDYVGFHSPDKFVVGYGMDYNGLYRNLPAIATIALPQETPVRTN